jgi:hypothetical protein
MDDRWRKRRAIFLRAALAEKTHNPANLFEAIRRRIGSLEGVELDIPRRGPLREPPRFGE